MRRFDSSQTCLHGGIRVNFYGGILLNTFREWLSDNLRYILLILIIALLGLFVFFGIRFVRSRIAAPDHTEESTSDPVYSVPQDAETGDSSTAESTAEEGSSAALSADIPDAAREAVVTYFNAAATGDTEALRSVVDTLSAADEEEFLASGNTTYTDLTIYTKPGLTEDALALFVTYKYTEDGVTLPGLSSLYVTGKDAPKIKTQLTAEEENYLTQLENDEDVRDLISRVRTDYVNALAAQAESSDAPAPAESQAEGSTEQPAESAEETAETDAANGGNAAQEAPAVEAQEAEGFKAGQTYTITTDCNVRKGPGYDNESLGVIKAGTEVEYVETSAGWHHIRGGGFDGYVGGSFLR